MKKANNFCWRGDDCENKYCKFIHPKNSSKKVRSLNHQSRLKHQERSLNHQERSLNHLERSLNQPERSLNQQERSLNQQERSLNQQERSSNINANVKDINHIHRKPSPENFKTMPGRTSYPIDIREAPMLLQISDTFMDRDQNIREQPPWQIEESKAMLNLNESIAKLSEEISKITLSDDYSTNFEKQQANMVILQGNIIELESHIQIFDSVKSRALRELSKKPKDLKDQIFREIYRFQGRLGAFGKRLEIEKYFTSGYRFLIVQGQTGSGKSTQIPQYLADHPRFYGKRIICTQPRKLAAISLTRRVSFEYSGGLNHNIHSFIGYQVGGDKRVSKDCRIEFVTEGIMLERIMKGDKDCFKNVGCIVIDEAHERSITCDLLLGSFKKPDPRWNDILIIATSATIDLNLFSNFFNNAPTVEIEGRTFPVDVIYQPVADETDISVAVGQCLEDILNAKSIFERNLKKASDNNHLLYARVLTLYGKQDPDKQAEIFEKLDTKKTRKIIFATDVAETSITIDGVVYVVDSGVKKEIEFDPQRNISSLKVNCISRSSAIQRAGRSGRTQPGTCYRLYSQDEFESMNINATPEILSKPISLAVLTLLEMSVDPIEFDWISCPSKEAMQNAEHELTILGAVDSNRKPTKLGKLISACQQDPKIMKLVYSACSKGLGQAACSVAAILTVSNIFFWNGNDRESKAKAIEQRKKFALPEGDIVTMYRIFEEWNDIYHGRKTYGATVENSEQSIAAINSKKQTSIWCKDNHVNGKAMFMAFTTKTDLIKQIKKTQVWRKKGTQNRAPTNLEVQQIICSGYFSQCARVFYSKNAAISVEYFSVESTVAGRLDNRSSFKLLDIEPPKWIVYDKIVRLPMTIFPIASVLDETWLQTAHPAFYKTCLNRIESLPTDLIVKSISQVCFRMIVGKNFCNVDSLEKEVGCLLTGDANTGQMYLYCAPLKKSNVDQLIQSKIDEALTEVKNQVIEEEYLGETRLVVGEGYQVREVLFQNEFATLYIKNIPNDFTKQMLRELLTRDQEQLATIDITEQGKRYTAIAKFDSKNDAKLAHERLLKEIVVDDGLITVSPSFGKVKGIRHCLNSRLKLTWPVSMSKGIANIYFNTAEGANQFVDDVYYIYPNVVVHVWGQTLKGAQMKASGQRPNILQPPLTYLKLRKGDRRCRFRYDLNAIKNMPNAGRLTYKVTLTGLGVSVDKHELMTISNMYDPRNVVLEREEVVMPQSGNGLSEAQKTMKLRPLSQFMDSTTKTRDFCNKKLGIVGICLFFSSNSTAKEAYDFAKQQYDVLKTDLHQPHHLEIEFTHMVSIHVNLFTFLAHSIAEFKKKAHLKGINAGATPNRVGSKFTIVKFQTNKHSNLDWIQKELDELTRPTKFICSNSHVFATWTGRHELTQLKNTSYIYWDNDKHVVWVYGSLEQKENITKKIESLANSLKDLDVLDKEIWLNKSVKINGKEGKKIATKCKEVKLYCHHFRGNKMYISGANESVASMVEFLKTNNFSLDFAKRNRFAHEEQRECGLCFAPPDDLFIMLSFCGHIFCTECIEPMVNMQPPPYPVKCPVCDQFVALHDIRKLAPKESLGKLLELAVQTFQQSHSVDVRKCPNPGCMQLLSYDQRIIGTKGGAFLFCDECITTFCIDCSDKVLKPIKSHDNESCDDIQSGVSNVVNKHVRIIQETIMNLACPKCRKAFFDFNGCAAVSCEPPCNAQFCGLCLKDCGANAHPHVRECPQNPGTSVFIDKKDLDKVHVKMRNEKLREYMRTRIMQLEVQQKVILSIQKDLIDLQMDVPIIISTSLKDVNEDSTELSISILRHIRTIQDNILNLKCPCCSTAFFDFDGSAVVNCLSCQRVFCGLCLRFHGNDTTVHVLRCEKNRTKGNFYVSSADLFKIHAAVRSENLRTYMENNIESVEVETKVVSNIRKDLQDLGMEIPVITDRQRIRLAAPINYPQVPPRRRVAYPMPQIPNRIPAADPIRDPPIPARRQAHFIRQVQAPPRRNTNCQIL